LHLAWHTKPPDYWESPLNADWARESVTLVRAFVESGGRHVVAAGTCAEYAWLGETCSEYRTPLRPTTTYGDMKRRAHAEIASLTHAAGIPFAWARIFFAYGPGEDSSKLFSSTLKRIRAGDTVALAQPRRRLDFIHVDDVARAFVGLVDVAADGPYNVATGNGTSIRDAVIALGAALGTETDIEYSGEVSEPDVIADVDRLRQTISWNPRSVALGVRSLVEGYAA
jgi:nucleoside-diphosphate-sugar epimerase